MWAPWRMEYILSDNKNGCIFCAALSRKDDLTLYKGKDTMVMMNKFPYINGHLLVSPIKHISTLDQLSKYEMGELLATINQSLDILKQVMGRS
jgi:ATP adenylyltransferase